MKSWWNQLSSRDQHVLTIGGIFVIVLVIYQFIWSPIQSSMSNLRQQISYQSELNTWMKQTLIQYKAQRVLKRKKVSLSNMLNLINTQLSTFQLSQTDKRLSQTQDGKIKLSFQQAPFDLLLKFLRYITKAYAINIEQLNVDAIDKNPGFVKASMILIIAK